MREAALGAGHVLVEHYATTYATFVLFMLLGLTGCINLHEKTHSPSSISESLDFSGFHEVHRRNTFYLVYP